MAASLSDLAAAAGFYADFHWGNCWAGLTSCGDALIVSHFWSLAVEMQFYALAPLLVLLRPRALTLTGLALLALGAASSRPAGQFWWAVRPDGLIVGVMLASQVAQRAAWLAKLPRVSLGARRLLAGGRLDPGAGVVGLRLRLWAGCDSRDLWGGRGVRGDAATAGNAGQGECRAKAR